MIHLCGRWVPFHCRVMVGSCEGDGVHCLGGYGYILCDGGHLSFLHYDWIEVTCECWNWATGGGVCDNWRLGIVGPSHPKIQPHLIQ